MRIVAQTKPAPAEDFAFCSGLLRAHVIERRPLDHLAAEYGLSLERLRARLLEHIDTCTAAVQRVAADLERGQP